MALELNAEISVGLKGAENFRKAKDGLNDVEKAATNAKKATGGFGDAVKLVESGLGKMWSVGVRAVKVLSDIAVKAGLAAVALGGAAAAMTGLFAKAIIGTSSQFENFSIQLETVFGDKGTATKMMDFIVEFAAKTPFTVEGLTQSAVTLQTYGLSAQKWLPMVSELAAGMGRDVTDAAFAVAKATVGESERLKELGITSRVLKEYGVTVNAAGAISAQTAEDVAKLEDAIAAVIGERFSGAIERFQTTWKGMTSNLEDFWTAFKRMIGEAGLFDAMKTMLKSFMDTLEEMKQSGTLQALAKTFSDLLSYIPALGQKMIAHLPNAVQTTQAWLTSLKDWLTDNAEKMWDAFINGANLAWKTLANAWGGINAWFGATFEGGIAEALTGAAYDFEHFTLSMKSLQTDLQSFLAFTRGVSLSFGGALDAAAASYKRSEELGDLARSYRSQRDALGTREERIAAGRAAAESRRKAIGETPFSDFFKSVYTPMQRPVTPTPTVQPAMAPQAIATQSESALAYQRQQRVQVEIVNRWDPATGKILADARTLGQGYATPQMLVNEYGR